MAEQYCRFATNLRCDVVTSVHGGTRSRAGGKPTEDAWHVMDASFDGPSGSLPVSDGRASVIQETEWTKLSQQVFVIGFSELDGSSRTMWYDDVSVGPSRTSCP